MGKHKNTKYISKIARIKVSQPGKQRRRRRRGRRSGRPRSKVSSFQSIGKGVARRGRFNFDNVTVSPPGYNLRGVF
jgi:hypothetical protein